MAAEKLTDPFDSIFAATIVSVIRASFLALTNIACPRELRRKFPVGLFHRLLYDLMCFDHGRAIVLRDPDTREEIYRYWTVTEHELIQRWSAITLNRINTTRHARAKAMAYYQAMSTMGLLFLEKQSDNLYQIQFPNMTQWMAQTLWELEGVGVLIDADLTKLNRLHWFGNGVSWDLLLPRKRKIHIHDNGCIQKVRSVPVCPKTWANFARQIVVNITNAILAGACDYHAMSKRPAKRKRIRQQRETLKNPSRDDIEDAKKEMKEQIRKQAEAGEPTFRSWVPSVAEMARFHRHSVTTEKRHRSLGAEWLITIERQALVVGDAVDGIVVRKLKAIRAKWGAQPLRFIPVPGRPGKWQPQLDVPSRIRWKKQQLNWPMYHDIPAELFCRPERKGPLPKECMEILAPRVTTHDSPYGKGSAKVLSPSVIRLAYLGDEGSPQMQEEMRRAGLRMWDGPFRRKIRVAARGTHHKDRTRIIRERKADGTWDGTLPLDVLDLTEADKRRRVHPQTLYRRLRKEDRVNPLYVEGPPPHPLATYRPEPSAEAQERYRQSLGWAMVGGFWRRIDCGPHRGLDQDLDQDLQTTGTSELDLNEVKTRTPNARAGGRRPQGDGFTTLVAQAPG